MPSRGDAASLDAAADDTRVHLFPGIGLSRRLGNHPATILVPVGIEKNVTLVTRANVPVAVLVRDPLARGNMHVTGHRYRYSLARKIFVISRETQLDRCARRKLDGLVAQLAPRAVNHTILQGNAVSRHHITHTANPPRCDHRKIALNRRLRTLRHGNGYPYGRKM